MGRARERQTDRQTEKETEIDRQTDRQSAWTAVGSWKCTCVRAMAIKQWYCATLCARDPLSVVEKTPCTNAIIISDTLSVRKASKPNCPTSLAYSSSISNCRKTLYIQSFQTKSLLLRRDVVIKGPFYFVL